MLAVLFSKSSKPAECDPAAHQLLRQQLEIVFLTALRNQILSPIAGVTLAVALWPVSPPGLLLTWIAALCVCSLVRHRIAMAWQRTSFDPDVLKYWERLFLFSIGLPALVWGAGALILMPADQGAHQVLIYCFVMGMAGGSATLYSAHGPSAALAISLILGPSTVYMFARGDLFHIVLGLAGILFVLGATRGTKLMNVTLRRNVHLTGELERMARFDELSSVQNRRGFFETSAPLVANATRSGRICALIMIDIDDFKKINDRTGHASGDAVIAAFGRLLADTLREGEPAGRIGGEEFAILLPDADADEAARLANRLLDAIRALRIEVDNQTLTMTVSMGIADTSDPPTSLGALLQKADKALYTAKRAGKDRVVVAEGAPAITAVGASTDR